jgi:hypothetical protein
VESLASEIRNAAWMVRHYALERTPIERARRAQAIQRMGLTVREAFDRCDDFEPLLAAICDGLKPRDERAF